MGLTPFAELVRILTIKARKAHCRRTARLRSEALSVPFVRLPAFISASFYGTSHRRSLLARRCAFAEIPQFDDQSEAHCRQTASFVQALSYHSFGDSWRTSGIF
jgi:hypothetical protein